MSYDLRLAVKAEGAEDCYVVFAEPERHSPTYNLGEMFRACTGWDYRQGVFYKVSEVLPLIEHGIHELRFNENAYEKYNPPNGWGSISSALQALESLLNCIQKESNGEWSWNKVPIDCMYVSW